MQTGSVGGSNVGPVATSNTDPLKGVDLDDFIQLMITELQNQDPLNPMDNSQILEQLSQIQSIESTKKLTTTLDAVLVGQSLSNASSLIGKQIKGLSDGGQEVAGKVDRVTVEKGTTKLFVGSQSVSLSNIREVLPS